MQSVIEETELPLPIFKQHIGKIEFWFKYISWYLRIYLLYCYVDLSLLVVIETLRKQKSSHVSNPDRSSWQKIRGATIPKSPHSTDF